MTISATLLPNGKQQFLSATGIPLAGGSVGMYAPGTLNFKNTWIDPMQSVLNANPITLDAAGEAVIYGSGQYRQIVKDALGNTIWDQLTQDFLSLAQTGQYFGGTSGGTANAQTITTSPTFTTYVPPLTITFTAGFTNTGPLTINANAIGPINVFKQTASGPVALTGGEIVNGNVYQIAFDGNEWQILTGSGSAVYWGATTGGTANAQTATSTPSFTAYIASLQFLFISGFTNTGATTININGIGAVNIFKETNAGPVALSGGEIIVGNIYEIVYDGTRFQLLSSSGGIAFGGTSGGTANAQTITVPGIALTAGAIFSCIAGFTNTAAATINVNGLGAVNIFKQSASGPIALSGGEIILNNVILLLFDGTRFQFLNPAYPAFTKSFVSLPQTITGGGTITPTHTLGVIPLLVYFYIQCTTADHGYNIGDILVVNPNSDNSALSRGFSCTPTSSGFTIPFGSQAGGVFVAIVSGTSTILTNTSWNFFISAYA